MKILKYLFLLLILATISSFVFILTQSGRYEVSKTFTVPVDSERAYAYLRDTDNWSDWIKTQKNDNQKIEVSFDGLRFRALDSQKEFLNDSLVQTLKTDEKTTIIWKFVPEKDKTTIHFSIKGVLDFRTKVFSFLDGSPTQIINRAVDTDLANLVQYFVTQYQDFDLETTGMGQQEKCIYLYANQRTTLNELAQDYRKTYDKFEKFLKSNQIQATGKPLLIVSQKNIKDSLSYRFALPIKQKVYLSSNDWVKLDSISEELIFKATLKGDYKHLPKALNEVKQTLVKNETLIKEDQFTYFILEESAINSRHPATWKTTFMLPIYAPQPKEVAPRRVHTELNTVEVTPEEQPETE